MFETFFCVKPVGIKDDVCNVKKLGLKDLLAVIGEQIYKFVLFKKKKKLKYCSEVKPSCVLCRRNLQSKGNS